jgi:hypothetical protein
MRDFFTIILILFVLLIFTHCIEFLAMIAGFGGVLYILSRRTGFWDYSQYKTRIERCVIFALKYIVLTIFLSCFITGLLALLIDYQRLKPYLSPFNYTKYREVIHSVEDMYSLERLRGFPLSKAKTLYIEGDVVFIKHYQDITKVVFNTDVYRKMDAKKLRPTNIDDVKTIIWFEYWIVGFHEDSKKKVRCDVSIINLNRKCIIHTWSYERNLSSPLLNHLPEMVAIEESLDDEIFGYLNTLPKYEKMPDYYYQKDHLKT